MQYTHRMREQANPEHIPTFRMRHEEAEFWDTHSFADYWDEFTPVKVRFAKELSSPVAVRLEAEHHAKRRRKSRRAG